jgi:cysteinyl-tRNA synthetase
VRDLTRPEADGGRADWGAPMDPLALRYALMAGHYSKPLDLTRDALHAAHKNIARFREADQAVTDALDAPLMPPMPAELERIAAALDGAYSEALAAMADDLHTPEALAAARRGVDVILSAARAGTITAALPHARQFLDRTNALLGIVRSEYGDAGTAVPTEDDSAEIDRLVAERTEARNARDFARADQLRAELTARNIDIMDSPTGTTWRRAL